MTLSTARVRKYLKDFDFEPLFIEELGWDRHAANLELTINGQQYPLRGFAEKRGVQVFECRAETPNTVPDFKTQRKIETQLRRAAREHLVIYTDATKTKQVWRPVDWRGHEFYPGHQSGDSLIEKLQAIQIPLDEEEALDLLGAVHKLRDAFDRDRITKRFYDHFQKEHKAFLEFIEGIPDQGEREWYASLMLNRLMFVYFIQKKGFLDRDTDYLRNRLKAVQSHKGKGKFQTFYRYFLLMLFHQGFSTQPEQRELDSDLKNLLGDVPYLNGGLFDVHELEQHNPKIDIPDEAFERIFDFFDQYEWTLDTRPLRNDREINPDVLGYIFEKYINQKQMGAYYTKEDITDYIGRNTIIPYLFDEARKKCAVAFQPGSAVWRLLQDTPDRYIYPAVRKGVIDDRGEIIPIPAEIEKGIAERRRTRRLEPAGCGGICPSDRDVARVRRPPPALLGGPPAADQRRHLADQRPHHLQPRHPAICRRCHPVVGRPGTPPGLLPSHYRHRGSRSDVRLRGVLICRPQHSGAAIRSVPRPDADLPCGFGAFWKSRIAREVQGLPRGAERRCWAPE